MIEIRKYRLYPTQEQVTLLEESLETCRKTWNFLLRQRKERRENSRREQYHSVFVRKQKNPSLQSVYSHVLQNVADRLDKSFRSFFKGIARYPRFKSFGHYDSFTYPDAYNGSVKLGTSTRKTKIYLSKIGYVPVVVHRDVSVGKNKRATVKREGEKWFVVLEYQVSDVPEPKVVAPKSPVGIDLGLLNIVATSNGETFKPLAPLKKNLKRLRRLQQSLSRKKKGSKNRRKAVQQVSRLHWRIGMMRRDFLHKLSRSIVNAHDFFALEDLNIKGMVRNHSLARSISDAGWNQLSSFIKYKAERQSKKVVFVSPNNTSTDCSRCGFRKEMDLSVRTWSCPSCGFETDRDGNSAIGVLNRGLREVGADCSELKPVESGVQSLNRWEIQPFEESGISGSSELQRGV
jgi:putative transposase